MFELIVATYAAGVAIGLLVMRDRWPVRLATALAWPLGVAAFVVVAVILTIAAIYLWPVPLLVTLGAFAAIWLVW
jgi:hypothetical protein